MSTVVITGGSRGIGAAAVEAFAARGDRVYFLYEKNHEAAAAVAAKTGTAEVGGGDVNGVFIAFAPFDNPEIAVSVVLEHGSSGFAAGTVVRKLLDAYFFTDSDSLGENMPFVVLD